MTNNMSIIVFVVVLLALLANKFFWFLPFVLIVPVIVTMVLKNPLILLGLLAVLLEVFSTSVPGMMIAVVLLPWLIISAIKRFRKELEIDFLLSFYLLVSLIIFSQLILISFSQAIDLRLRTAELQMPLWQMMLAVPWLKAAVIVAASTFVAATALIFIRFNTSWQ